MSRGYPKVPANTFKTDLFDGLLLTVRLIAFIA